MSLAQHIEQQGIRKQIIKNADEETLLSWSERVLDAKELKEVFVIDN